MFEGKLNKAVAALLSALVFILNRVFGWDLGLSDEAYMSIAGLVTTLLVWAAPNLTEREPPAGS
jgi:branched-subunit amino acid transport protein